VSIPKLIHDEKRVHACLHETPEGSLIALKPMYVQIPVRFSERMLAYVGKTATIIGICAFVTADGFYGVSLINAMFNLKPSKTEIISIDGVGYYNFHFDAGDTVLEFTDLVKNDKLVFRIYDELMSKGNVPWYIDYLGMGSLFDTANKHAGAPIGEEQEVTQLLASMLSRDNTNRKIYYRQTLKSMDDLKVKRPAFISLRSIQFSATNTVDKLAGSYFTVGLTSALVSPTTRVENIDNILRQ
jgi:hypothetical protein